MLRRLLIREKRLDLCVDVAAGQAGGIQGADDGTDTGSRDHVRVHTQFVQRLEHQDVRESLRAAATQRQADARLARELAATGAGHDHAGCREPQELAA